MPRETIATALFSRLQGISAATISRKLKHWTDTPAEDQPALFMGPARASIEQRRGFPKKISVIFDLYAYVREEDPAATAATRLNSILDEIETALEPEPGESALTLGIPEVSHCWIADEIETDEGVLGEQAVAIVPVHVLFFFSGTQSEIAGLINEDTGQVLFNEDTGFRVYAEEAT